MLSSMIRYFGNAYIAAREWDLAHYDLVSKTKKFVNSTLHKLQVEKLVKSMIDQMQTFNKEYKVTETIVERTKTFDDKLSVTELFNKFLENETIKRVSSTFNDAISSTMETFDEVGKEIKDFENKNGPKADVNDEVNVNASVKPRAKKKKRNIKRKEI